MRSRACALGPEERRRRRLHYCGTCKTMGRLYGQRSRLLLNFDTVFAAELLTALSGTDVVDAWDGAYHARNCFSLPEAVDAMPAALRYAAAMTVVLAEVKVADQIADAPGATWRAARRLLSPSFRRASADLEADGFPLDALWRSVRAQDAREARLGSGATRPPNGPDDALGEAARATADATALAFAHGALVAGVPQARETLAELGRAFGSVVYLLDALDDYERDARSGEFNAIRAAYALDGDSLPAATRREVEGRLRRLVARVETALGRLPIAPERAALFVDRLRANLARARVVRRLPVAPSAPSRGHACARATLAARRAAAAALAKATAARHLAACRPLPVRWAETPFVFALAGVAGFVAPHLVSGEPSVRDCFDATFNVAALGSALASMAMPPPPPDQLDPARRQKQAAASGTGTGDSCDCCDCCDCCSGCDCASGSHCSGCCCDCDGCGGCCGSCDGCDCCACSCD